MSMCVCEREMDPRRHGRPPVIFQQLFPLCSCTAADRTLQITLIVPTAVCDSPEGSGARCRGTTLTPCGGAPYIHHYGYRQRSGGAGGAWRLPLAPKIMPGFVARVQGRWGGGGGSATPTGENTHYNFCRGVPIRSAGRKQALVFYFPLYFSLKAEIAAKRP